MKNNKKITLNKIPSALKNIPFPKTVDISSKIAAAEGSIILVEVENQEGKLNTLDLSNGRLGRLWQWDKIPAVIGYRKATTEFAGFVPHSVKVGDELHLLCESGVVGSISGVFETWGRPMKVKVLGSILDQKGKPMNLKQFILPKVRDNKKAIPLVVFLGTRMDSGKTTIACKTGHKLKALGKKVAGLKLTGTAFTQDLMKLEDAGVSPTYDFVDMGLPSTCNGNPQEIVNSSLNLINFVKKTKPDCILVEFGDAVLGEYHVADVLQNPVFKSQINTVILAAHDLAGIKGTLETLSNWDIAVDLITGPIANSKVGIELVDKYFKLPAESNMHDIPKTIELLEKKMFQKGKV